MLSLRGAVRRSVEVPLEWGVQASSDVVPSISLHLEAPGVASLVIDLPGVPGESRTPEDGDSAGPGEAQVWWSLHGGVDSGTHLAAYGHACRVHFEADAVGRLAGRIGCPNERLGRRERYGADITFEAIPLVSGPLPTPMPTPSPAPQSVTEAPCELLDAARRRRDPAPGSCGAPAPRGWSGPVRGHHRERGGRLPVHPG